VALSINEIKSGVTVFVEGEVYMIIEAQHVKPGKGAAFVRARMRNMKNSGIQEMTFRGDTKIEQAYVEERNLQYQYNAGHIFHFMDQDNFEEVGISEDAIGDNKKFLKDALEVTGYFYKGEILSVSLPNFIEFEIKHTEPGIKGDTAKAGTKTAEIETDALIQVPLFINSGDKVKIDTRTGEYVERVC